jgi:tRNA(Ile)-lysidine synthase
MQNHPFIRSVEKTIHQFGMLQPGDTILVAVSGGPDSVALLHALTALQSKLDFQLAVAHLNHGLRPKTAASDADFVAVLCQKQGLRCHQKAIDLNTDQNSPRSSPEARARQARYDFFGTIARENSYTKIATGHHANDNAELILMNLFRGSGSLGLAGIPPVRGQRIIRPLLHQTRQQILNFLETFKLEFVQDETNRDIRFLRNRIRHELLPDLLQEYNPNLVDTLNRTADVLRVEQEFIRQSAQQALDRMTMKQDTALHLSISSLQQLHLALQRRIIRLAIGKLKGDLRKVTFRHIDSVLQLCHQGLTGQRVSLPDGILVQRYPQDVVRLVKRPLRSRKLASDGEADAIPLYKVSLPTTDFRIQHNEIKALSITLTCQHVTTESVGDPSYAGQNTAFFDMDQLTSPLDLRPILPGDRFRPLGLMGTQKVKDFLINTKIPRDERRRILVLLNQDHIIWILGHRIDDRVKITQQTKNVLKIEISHQE